MNLCLFPVSILIFLIRFYSIYFRPTKERATPLTRNGNDCMENVQAMRSTIFGWVIQDFSVNMKAKVSLMQAFILIESEFLFFPFNISALFLNMAKFQKIYILFMTENYFLFSIYIYI